MCDFRRVKSQRMDGRNKKFVRFRNEVSPEMDMEAPCIFNFESSKAERNDFGEKAWLKGLGKFRKSLNFGVSRVFSEDHEPLKTKIFDPRSRFIQRWNTFFVVTCLLAVFIDPLFFYLPVIDEANECTHIENRLKVIVTVLRTMTDTLYLFHIVLQYRTAFIAPSSRVFGRGELVVDSLQIARRYLKKDFWLDVAAVLPLPQIFIWGVIPAMGGTVANNTKNTLRFIVLVQYVPRLFRIFPLTSHMVKTTGVVMETAWAGAAYNLLLYMLASHVLGACWYLLSVEAQDRCWRKQCTGDCDMSYFDCSSIGKMTRNTTAVKNACSVADDNNFFNYGIYGDALKNGITSTTLDFVSKYFYCLWWGLRNLSTLGQGLITSSYNGEVQFSIAVAILGILLFAFLLGNMQETTFAILIAILGLVFFAFLIGNMQTYLQSVTVRLEEMRVKRRDAEQWMRHRQLPPELRERVRRYEQYKWIATRGVDEELLVQNLPLDLRRDIKRHLCLDLVRRVPMFDQMDERLLEAICERLKPALYTEETYIVKEGDPLNEMLFIIRGRLESVTTNGGRTGFYNAGELGPGDFCGEELLTWALHPKPSKNLPSSTRTVIALVEVEAFALHAEDLKFVAGQFRRMHSKQLQHTFRYYSQQWRTWAALYVQAAWRRFQRRKILDLQQRNLNYGEAAVAGKADAEEVVVEEDEEEEEEEEEAEERVEVEEGEREERMKDEEERECEEEEERIRVRSPSIGATILASRFAANALRGVQRMRCMKAAQMSSSILLKPQKPAEPDFTVVDEDE